jgi:heme exporter protein B
MMRAIRPVLTLTWKDILLEIRSKDILLSVVVFGVVVVVMFNFALNVDALSADRLAPGILWVAFAFSGVLAMNRSYALEKDRGSLEGLLLCPISGDELYFGKMLGIFLFMIIIQVILLAVFSILFNFSGFSASLGLAIVLATLGFASVGTLFAAIAVQTRSREIMLPILFFPIVLPVLVGAIEITSSAIAGDGIPGTGRWLPLLAIFDAMFLVLCPWVFRSVLEE